MGLLLPHTGTVIWMLIAFLSVFFILKKFAWKPLLTALKSREDSIESALKAADNAKKGVEKLQAENEIIKAEARKERDKIIAEARNLKDSIITEAKNQAAGEADKIVAAARDTIKSDKESAISELKEYAAGLSISMAEKLLKEKLVSDDEQKELINRLLRELKVN